VQYEIDLNKKNARAFRKKLAPFVEHARKAGPGQRRGPAWTASSRQRSADIRAWAKATGLPVSDRGRIPASVADQYEAATRRYLRTPRHRRHEPIRSGGPWPRAAGQQRATGPSRLPTQADVSVSALTRSTQAARLAWQGSAEEARIAADKRSYYRTRQST
jgi:hypothetical protein